MGVIDRDTGIYEGLSRLRQFARYALGRVVGTVPSTNGRYKWFIDHAESRHFHRVELNAIEAILIKKGVCTQEEWQDQVLEEIRFYEEEQKKEWPDISVAQDGRSFVLHKEAATKRMAAEMWPE